MGGWVGSTIKLPFIYLFASSIFIKCHCSSDWRAGIPKCVFKVGWMEQRPHLYQEEAELSWSISGICPPQPRAREGWGGCRMWSQELHPRSPRVPIQLLCLLWIITHSIISPSLGIITSSVTTSKAGKLRHGVSLTKVLTVREEQLCPYLYPTPLRQQVHIHCKKRGIRFGILPSVLLPFQAFILPICWKRQKQCFKQKVSWTKDFVR